MPKRKQTALILVDLQNDFVEGGALAVPDGLAVVQVANQLVSKFDLVVATQDWHPADHQSFASQHPGMAIGQSFQLNGLAQIAWPDHCVNNTFGAELVEQLNQKDVHHIIRKGMNPSIDSYSGFFDNGHRKGTGLAELLRENNIEEVAVMGLATDYCVRFTAIDAVQQGFQTKLIVDGCRGVELMQGDIERAIQSMGKSGVAITQSNEILDG